jgi:hydrogenase expression/formation protein HypC
MCLAIPGRILKINEMVGTVDFGGVRRDVRLDLLKRVQEGDYILVHVGYAIQVLNQAEAEKILKSWAEIARG